jgi:hypothetical protein
VPEHLCRKRKASPKVLLARHLTLIQSLNAELVTAAGAPDFLCRALGVICERVDFVDNYLKFQAWSVSQMEDILSESNHDYHPVVDTALQRPQKSRSTATVEVPLPSLRKRLGHRISAASSQSLLAFIFSKFREMLQRCATEFAKDLIVTCHRSKYRDTAPCAEYLLHSMEHSSYEKVYATCYALISKAAFLKDLVGVDGNLYSLSAQVLGVEDAQIAMNIHKFKASMGCAVNDEKAVNRRLFDILCNVPHKSTGLPFQESVVMFQRMADHPAPHDKLQILLEMEDSIWCECHKLVQTEVTPDLFNAALVYIIVVSSHW